MSFRGDRFLKIFALLLSFALPLAEAAVAAEVSFLFAYDPSRPEEPATRKILDLARSRSDLVPVKWGGLRLPGGGGRATFMLGLAAQSAPDVYKAWFHILRHDIDQGFIYPLDEWLGTLPPKSDADLWEKVRYHKGHYWALPSPAAAYYGIVYRKDFAAASGLNPESPPRTWSGFRDWCVKLTTPSRKAFAIENRPWGFLPWVQSAGGDVIRLKDSDNPDLGYEAAFNSPEAVKAARYLQELHCLGVIRAMPTLTTADEVGQLFSAGKIAAVFGGEDLVRRLTETLGMPPETIGIMPFPAADHGGVRVLQAHRHFYAMSEGVSRRPKEERDIVFECLKALVSPEIIDDEVRRNVAEGRAMWCKPADLERLGYKSELAALPMSVRQMYEDLERGEIKAVTEPWVGFWQGASDLVQRKFLGLLLSDAGKDLDCEAALTSITEDANRGLMFDSDRAGIDAARPYARVIVGIVVVSLLIALYFVFASRRRRGVTILERSLSTAGRFTPVLFLAPAVLSILLWSYYPLVRGAMMAFQEYRIVGGGEWIGLDNFIRVATDPSFWTAWARTLKFVAITLMLGFFAPVFLALMLCEIPRGKIFFRFLYFLPHLTSALVVTLMWKMMFDPSSDGLINSVLGMFGIPAQSWLLDPSWAMTCCILPGVWAGAGISSLIYIAALESLPRDYYEAAAIDGAGILSRFWHITFPQLAPLMVINFVGAFIAAFQGMGSIFLLTFGGPGDATQVVSLQIWKEAYNNLRFSTATTMAWFLGCALIGFTYLQIRLLRRVEFRQAAAN